MCLAIKVLSASLAGDKKHIFYIASKMQDIRCHRYSEEAGELWVREESGEDSKEADGTELTFDFKMSFYLSLD